MFPALNCRKHSAVLTDFGGVGDGKTSNTQAFKAAITNLSQLAVDGGAQLIVPPGKWLTGSFNLTRHFTLFVHKDAVILGAQVQFLARNFSFTPVRTLLGSFQQNLDYQKLTFHPLTFLVDFYYAICLQIYFEPLTPNDFSTHFGCFR